MLQLDAQVRKDEKPETLRASGMVPAVFYGFGKEATKIAVPAIAFTKLFREAGETTAITLSLDGQKVPVLVHDIQQHPITGDPSHIDFLVVDMNKEVDVSVPIEFDGVADVEKSGTGIVMKVMHELEVRALPADLPHAIHVDISTLVSLESIIYAKDVALPNKVTLVTDPEEVVASVSGLSEEKEEEAAPVDFSAIEVEKKGKKEEEEVPAE